MVRLSHAGGESDRKCRISPAVPYLALTTEDGLPHTVCTLVSGLLSVMKGPCTAGLLPVMYEGPVNSGVTAGYEGPVYSGVAAGYEGLVYVQRGHCQL